ncbi:MAG: family 10 glycosylhydrolase [Candidatus Poribacteria bacterium]|nr:family 10 glycosylhydrolase [Candidatus Poribacteria bacterium]
MKRSAGLILLIVLLLSRPLPVLGEKIETVIEDFSYVDDVAAREVWISGNDVPPVESAVRDGERGVRISAPFSQGLERTIHDRAISLDLNRHGYFTLDVFTENPEAFSSFTLYFRSGNGWYGASGSLEQSGRQQLAFNKAAFRSEGNPTGWHRITGIRLSAWAAAPIDSALIVERLTALSHDIVMILPTDASGTSAGDIRTAQRNAELLSKMLQGIGLPADVLEDRMVSSDVLKGRRLVILPLNPKIPSEVAADLRRFVAGGGKLFVTYSLADSVGDVLHLRRTAWVQRDFASIRLDAPDIAGLPQSVKQASWNITVAEPTNRRTRAVGYWHDDLETPTGYPALFLGDNGAFLSHIILPDDRHAKEQLLAALFGHLVPDFWHDMAKSALNRMTAVGHLKGFEATREFIKDAKLRNALETERSGTLKALTRAEKLMQNAQTLYTVGDFVAAVDTARMARAGLSEVYLLSHPSPKREGRAVWNRSGTGAYPGDWNRSASELAKAGFNMIIPNMLWAGVAHYPSTVLPRSDTFAKYGDQISQCVEAAHRHGLEVHVWKANWNLQGAPDDFVEKMRAAGRTQVSRTGEPIHWLCPSHPDNVQLELNSLLEVVRDYDVDGIHLDYIRYPGPEACYCDGCRERFSLATRQRIERWPADVLRDGPLRETYLDWRVEQITRFVRLVHKRTQALRPDLKISAAVFGNYPDCVQQVGQDWVAWAEAGYVDFLCPMNYTDDDHRFTRLVERQLELTQNRIPLYPGIGATTSSVALTPDRVVGQIYLARRAGASGFAIFDFSTNTVDSVIQAFGLSAGITPAQPVHKGLGK